MPQRNRWILATALVAALAVTGCAGQPDPGPVAEATATTTTNDPGDATFPDEDVPSSSIPPAVAKKVGQTAQFFDVETGKRSMNVQVARVKFTRGEEWNRPERGLFLGVYVKTRAFEDDVTSLWGDIYVTQRGHHYDGDAYADGFTPALDYVNLHKGETAEGWLVFDVPAKHGQVVLASDTINEGAKLATWDF